MSLRVPAPSLARLDAALGLETVIALRFVHTADWQLGMTRHFLDADAQPRYTEARLAAVRRIGELAEAHDCAFVLVCGDVFESNQLSTRTVGRALEVLRTIPVPVYLLPGNHDPLDAASIYRSEDFRRRCPHHVHVLDTPGIHPVGDGAELVAAPWYSKRPGSDLVADRLAELSPSTDVVRVLAGHGGVDSLGMVEGRPEAIRMDPIRAAIADRRVDYVALGDSHSLTDLGVDGRAWYSGTQEVTDYDEDAPGHALVVDVDAAGCTVTPHRVGTWRFAPLTHHLGGAADVDALRTTLSTMDNKDRTVVKLSLVGTLSLAEKARLDDLLDQHAPLFAGLQHWRRHTDLAVLPDDGDLGDLGLSGFAASALEELRATAASGGSDGETAQAALGLLYRLAGGGRSGGDDR